ncbi:MAG: crossover junction endodeoxyribonuclease RuvC [Verrucomicrobiia bacterium]
MGISIREYEALLSRRKKSEGSEPARNLMDGVNVIIGIDPSLRGTGYGIISVNKKRVAALSYGTIKCPKDLEHSKCLLEIGRVLREVIREYKPQLCVVEGLFYAQNIKTALVMGEARGASLFAAAESGIDVYEIAPRKVKKAITGYGGAQKRAVAKMVQRILGLNEQPEPDAADALALAITFAQECAGLKLSPLKKI